MIHIRPILAIYPIFILIFSFAAEAQRATVAILPFQNKAGIDNRISDALVDMATTSLTQTRKFDVVERASLETLAEELNLSESGWVDSKSAAEWGKLKGADYLIIGIVTEAGRSHGGVGLGGFKVNPTSVALAIDVRFVDSSTGSVVFADSLRDEKKGLGLSLGTIEFDPESEKGGEMARAVIDALTTKIMLTVYPPKVVKFDESTKEITLNYGDIIFEDGQLWDVFQEGEVVIDPDTGESLGNDETKVGQIRITSTMDKLSKATLLSGSAHDGAVCRLVESEAKSGKNPLQKLKGRRR